MPGSFQSNARKLGSFQSNARKPGSFLQHLSVPVTNTELTSSPRPLLPLPAHPPPPCQSSLCLKHTSDPRFMEVSKARYCQGKLGYNVGTSELYKKMLVYTSSFPSLASVYGTHVWQQADRDTHGMNTSSLTPGQCPASFSQRCRQSQPPPPPPAPPSPTPPHTHTHHSQPRPLHLSHTA